jgi:hypothetical protein
VRAKRPHPVAHAHRVPTVGTYSSGAPAHRVRTGSLDSRDQAHTHKGCSGDHLAHDARKEAVSHEVGEAPADDAAAHAAFESMTYKVI